MNNKFKSNIKEYENKLKKVKPTFWVDVWKWLSLAAFFIGLFVGGNYYEHKANTQLNLIVDDMLKNSDCFENYYNLKYFNSTSWNQKDSFLILPNTSSNNNNQK